MEQVEALLEEAAGMLEADDECSYCYGSGGGAAEWRCPHCHGTGDAHAADRRQRLREDKAEYDYDAYKDRLWED